MRLHIKHTSQPGYLEWEAAGLRWLAAADGCRVVRVVQVEGNELRLEAIQQVDPSAHQIEDFGRGLAQTHAAGASAYGVGPDGWAGDGWLGPADEPLRLPLRTFPSWGRMYAEARLLPTTREGVRRSRLSEDDMSLVGRVADRLSAGDFDTDELPARIHGDLWTGNLLWSRAGGVLIDPAAHGGHRETDLAMLALFGAPDLDRLLAAYDEAAPLAAGWQDRVALHQLHPLLLHAVLFGAGYAARARAVAARFA